jgi:hypothetical protein
VLNDLIRATVEARVEAGFVTLSGVAAWQFQRHEAESACAAVPGVMGVDVAISLHPAPGHGDIQQAISAASGRSARLDRFELSVDSPRPGMVLLSGKVSSWAERDDAVTVAWSAPGITDVDDRIMVAYASAGQVMALVSRSSGWRVCIATALNECVAAAPVAAGGPGASVFGAIGTRTRCVRSRVAAAERS